MKITVKLLAALCLCAAAAGCSAESWEQTLTPLPDRPQAPDFDLEDANGERIGLSDFRGRPLIVNFWATWCPPCRQEMPSMQRAWEQLSDEGIGLVAINVGEDADTIFQFTADYPVEFPLPMDLDSKIVQAWPVKGLPTTFVVDAEGRLAFRAVGGREWDDPQLLDAVRALLPKRE
jgi:peroxiredoxin